VSLLKDTRQQSSIGFATPDVNRKPLNIVIINDNAHVNGGAAKIAIMNAHDLAERGHRIFFLCALLPIAPELSSHPNITVICSDQYEIILDPNRTRAFVQGWWNVKAERIARKSFTSLDVRSTVVHLHSWAKALSSSVTRVAIDRGFPMVCTLHDFMLACPTGTLFNHSEQKVCKLTPMSSSCICSQCDARSYPQKLWRVGRQLIQTRFGQIPHGISDFIAHSELVSEVMRPHLPEGSEIHAIPSYIEGARTEPSSPAEQQKFAYLGRLVREKGVLMLARCAAAERLPVVFVGSGELAGEVMEINPEATVTGWVSSEQSLEYLRSSRALVFPSLWYETLGLVVLEAAANGIPSIVPDTSAAREIVIDGVTGLYFRGGDEQDLRAKMRQLQDPQLAQKLGRAAYDRFWSHGAASSTAHVDALEVVYRRALQRNHMDQQYDLRLSESVV
jgi:glycosyltransferase involved in cell wall biosynthesis